jgi:hypothetical protein
MSEEIYKLIPELSSWNEGGISFTDWIKNVGRYDHALGYIAIFWPDFVCYKDSILRRATSDENYGSWMGALNNDTSKVEAMMNHLHLVDMFHSSEYKPSKALLVCLGKKMKEMWSSKLALDFPDRRFEVELSVAETDNLTDIEITFYQLPIGKA